MGSEVWGEELAATYDQAAGDMFAAEVLDPAVDRLVELAKGGRVLELAIGTGRVALPLAARGIEVHGIELSPHMVDQLRAKPGGADLPVTVGDMATTRLAGRFALVYLVWNGIMNLTTQAEQVAVFERAADHLDRGGRLVVEVMVPDLRGFAPTERGRVLALGRRHVSVDTLDDVTGQILSSHHWFEVDGRLVHHSAPYRYVWPAELDLMARVAGLDLVDRWSDWHRTPFSDGSDRQIAIYHLPR